MLGHLCKRGPSTPYAIRRTFLQSPSSHWSGSAGAVYPALERLEKLGLVRARHAPNGRRDGWRYELTSSGRRRFLAWLEPPFASEVLSVPPDPLRTRLSFLSVLPPARRKRYFDASVRALSAHLEALRASSEDEDDDERHAHAAGTHAMRARIEWMRSFRA